MFGEGQAVQTQPAVYVTGYANSNLAPTPPQENGVISTVKELLEAVNDNSATVRSVEDALGISTPEPKEDGTSTAPQSLVQVLRSAIYRVRSSNEHLYKVLSHINS